MTETAAQQLALLDDQPPRTHRRHHRKLAYAQNTLQYIREAQQEANETLQYTLSSEIHVLVNLLIQQKKLPTFYFVEEAKKSGIPQKIYNSWKIKTWPYRQVRNTDQIRDITLVLLLVRIRLWKYPIHESYWEAQTRLIERVTQLKADGWTHNQIALAVRKSHSTLTEILSKTEGSRPRHCPWELLHRLDLVEEKEQSGASEELDEKPHQKKQERSEAPPISNQEVTRQIKAKLILPGDPCYKCQAPWTNLITTKDTNPAFPDLIYHQCMVCGIENLTGEVRPYIERRGQCGHCGAAWHHLKKQDEDAGPNFQIYLCLNCYDECRVPASRKQQ